MLKETLVMKFGGTSVGSVEALKEVIQIISNVRSKYSRVIVVTSALSGVTDMLLESANYALQKKESLVLSVESVLKEKHFKIADIFIKDRKLLTETKGSIVKFTSLLISYCNVIASCGQIDPSLLDAVSALGERMSAQLVAAVATSAEIRARAIESIDFLVTNGNYQNASPDFEVTAKRIRLLLNPLLEQGIIPVTTGYIGATPDGMITTLGRGGSDYSAAIVGSTLPADDVWIWTDVDGVMTADPRIVSSARTLPEISYREIAELTFYGARILHPKTIHPIVDAGIGLRICNTFNSSHPGTRLTLDRYFKGATQNEQTIKAVTALHKQKLIVIEGCGLLSMSVLVGRTFDAIAVTDIAVSAITQTSTEQSICFAVSSESANFVLEKLQSVFAAEIIQKKIHGIWAIDDIAIVTLIGTGIRTSPKVLSQVLDQLDHYKINVVAFGSSDVSINIVVEGKDTECAVQRLHELIPK